MPALPTNFAALALYQGILEASHFLFLQTGSSAGYLDLMVATATGTNRMFSLNNKVLLDGSGSPTGLYTGVSWSGDYYIDYANWKIHKHTGSSWNTGVSLIGATGGSGPSGASSSGAVGSGVPISGYAYEVLTKDTAGNYDTGWRTFGDLNRGYYSRLGRTSQFREVYRNLGLRGAAGAAVSNDMGSGCTYNPLSNTLFVVDNGTPSIAEYSIDGQHIRTIALSGFKDVEAIDYLYHSADQYFFVIAEEYNAAGAAYLNKLQVIKVPKTGSVTITNNPGVGYHDYEINLGPFLTNAAPNVGIEGVAFNPDKNLFYVVTEKTANEGWKVWEVPNNPVASITACFDLTAAFLANSLTVLDISDIAYRRNQNTLVMVSEEGAGYILEFGLGNETHGQLLDYRAAPTAFYQVEGVCFSPNGRYMFLTGEANTVGGDRPDYMIFEWNDGSNPTSDEKSHGLIYFQNGVSTSINGKLFELSKHYSTTVENTDKSLVVDWPMGTRDLKDDMMKRGKKIAFSAFGDFVPNGPIGDTATLRFGVLDTGDINITPTVTLTGISSANTGYWTYNGQITFSELGFYNLSALSVTNNSGYAGRSQICQSGLISTLNTGDIDFVSKFVFPSTSGALTVYQFSVNID